jgi:hypothetical protein
LYGVKIALMELQDFHCPCLGRHDPDFRHPQAGIVLEDVCALPRRVPWREDLNDQFRRGMDIAVLLDQAVVSANRQIRDRADQRVAADDQSVFGGSDETGVRIELAAEYPEELRDYTGVE